MNKKTVSIILFLSFINLVITSCVTSSNIQPYTGTVLILENSISPKIKYRIIKQLKISKKWYGSVTELYPELANHARKLGANAVINTNHYFAPSGFSWSAPHLSGQAIFIEDEDSLNTLEGKRY